MAIKYSSQLFVTQLNKVSPMYSVPQDLSTRQKGSAWGPKFNAKLELQVSSPGYAGSNFHVYIDWLKDYQHDWKYIGILVNNTVKVNKKKILDEIMKLTCLMS